MTQIIHLISAYLKTQKNYLDSKPQIITNDNNTCINFVYYGIDIEVCIYNDTFIKLKVNNMPYAICNDIKSFRYEIERLHALRYQ